MPTPISPTEMTTTQRDNDSPECEKKDNLFVQGQQRTVADARNEKGLLNARLSTDLSPEERKRAMEQLRLVRRFLSDEQTFLF